MEISWNNGWVVVVDFPCIKEILLAYIIVNTNKEVSIS